MGIKFLTPELEALLSKTIGDAEKTERELNKEIQAVLKNISIQEAGEIIAIAEKLGQEGFTEGEALGLGIRIIKAASAAG